MNIEEIEKEILLIKERNRKVEIDKAWERSAFRKILVAALTYLVIVLLFFAMKLPDAFVNALVPTAAFMLSTLSLTWFKKFWIRHVRRNADHS